MSKDTSATTNAGLEALQRLVQDHGDGFRWAISKRGRIWLTLTHWDTEKYNTSVEVDGMSNVADVLDALHVLVFAHYAKCFGSMAHQDTWLGVEATRSAVNDAKEALPRLFQTANDDVHRDGKVPTSTSQER